MKLMKRLAITGACALVMGGVMALIAFGVLGFDASALDTEDYTFGLVSADTLGAEDGSAPAVINEIDVDFRNLKVEIVGGDKFAFQYYTTENLDVEYGFDEDTGKFTAKTVRKGVIFRAGIFEGIKENSYAYKITVPSGSAVRLDNRNCSVTVSAVSAKEIALKGANATVRMTDLTCDAFSCSASNATLGAEKCEFGKFGFEGSNSTVRFDNCKADEVSAVSSNGTFKADTSDFGSVKFDGNNATLKFRGCTGEKFELDGNNATFDVSVRGQKSDFAYISMAGNNASFRLGGERFGGVYEGSGTKRFTARGNNMTAKLSFE